ncbi:hypothetical protein GCM10027074_43920 [Streptomyces deserti]
MHTGGRGVCAVHARVGGVRALPVPPLGVAEFGPVLRHVRLLLRVLRDPALSPRRTPVQTAGPLRNPPAWRPTAVLTTVVPLMPLDLDNTLVDRDAAFRGAVAAFLET